MSQKPRAYSAVKLKVASPVGAMNQQGNVTIFGLFTTLILSFLLLIFLYHHSNELKLIKERSKIFLCTKKFYQAQETLVNDMERLNLVIKDSTYLEFAKFLFPVLAPLPAKEIKSSAQKLQLILVYSYLKKVSSLRINKCPIDPLSLKTPYLFNAMSLERKINGESILRSQQWTNILKGDTFSLILNLAKVESWKNSFQGTVTQIIYPKVTQF
ncbi:MAG: hypothetical protein ACOYL6_00175 [Bacteriovoracaceae bacterium]